MGGLNRITGMESANETQNFRLSVPAGIFGFIIHFCFYLPSSR